jgi:hypothetical protein
MDPLKACDLCGCTSNDTAIFTAGYAKGELNICIECLANGIKEVKTTKTQELPSFEEPIEKIDIELLNKFFPEEVFGFNCEKCGNIMFSAEFPITCSCGHQNHSQVLEKQNLINARK